MRVMVVMGTRPEAIKLAPVIKALRARGVDTRVVSTGQHREMLAQALSYFAITPDVDAGLMQPNQSLNGLTGRVLLSMDDILTSEQPDWVLVQGDTTTAFGAALAAFHRGIRVGHIEAGLRTGDLASPFPEEANRSLIARITTLNFAPTLRAQAALQSESIPLDRIFVTGNTVVDAIADVLPPADRTSTAVSRQVLVTCHRRENFGTVMLEICQMLRRLCARYGDYEWVFPVHLNPSVREPVYRILSDVSNLRLIDPVSYPESLRLIASSALIVSDSGGIQEEAPSFGVPVVVMRSHTERFEGVESGFATLAGQAPVSIEAAIASWIDDPIRRSGLRGRANPYGDGQAADRIVRRLLGEPVEAFLA